MNVFQLMGRIAIDNNEANEALRDTSNRGREAESRLGKAFKGMGKFAGTAGKAIATGLGVASVAFGKMFIKGLNLAGELEQQIGGTEAVFGEFARTIQSQGAYAYSTMGLSQAEFMATANKMGALLKGSGFDTKSATDLTVKAMQRASDVASIMGIDISSAMDSIAGACKGNFTMMDNLGVAINDTTLNNYALEKGLKKTTAQMTTQEKVGLALELFLEKSAYAAGNYVKENDTLAGSLQTAKAAFTNFMSGGGNPYAVVSAMSNAANVVVGKITELAPVLASGFGEIVNGLAPKIGEVIKAMIPALTLGAVSLIIGVSKAIPQIVTEIVNQIPFILSELATGLEEALPEIVASITTTLSSIGNNLPEILRGVYLVFSTLWANGFYPLIQKMFEFVFGIELPDWEEIKTTVSNKVKEIYDGAKEWLSAKFGITLPDFEEIGRSIVDWWNTKVKPSIQSFIQSVFSLQLPDIKKIIEDIKAWWEKIKAGIQLTISYALTGNKTLKERSDDAGNGMIELPSGRLVPALTVDHEANGLDFVNRDRMPAILHYGEAVLNRTDAREWRDGSGNGGMMELAGKMDALINVMQNGFNNMGNNNIVLDSGALVGQMVNGMDARLGRMATYRGRRG